MKKTNSKKNNKVYILLHILLLVYSFSGVLSKLASGENFLSFKFCLYYGGIIFLLGIYAIFWQQIIKRLDLTMAYANRAVAVVWGILWGFLLFSENITIGKIVGALLIIAGIVLFCFSNSEKEDK
jgi:drug/metabolite transporter (DMT)-like permease